MPISISKFFTLDFTYSNNDVYYNNNIDGIEITDVNGARDLGVLVDNRLSFAKHIACIVSKAKLRTAQLFKCFTTRKYKDLLQGYKSYALPLVTYCSSVWSPSGKNDIAKVELVQKYFSKNIRQCKFLPYLERLKFLDLLH